MFWCTTYSNMVTIQRWTKEIKLQQRTESLSFFLSQNHCSRLLNSKNYESSISQVIHWNDNPFGQDVEHVLVDNILKFGDDPTLNQRDRASTTPELWGPYLTVRWLEWRSVLSRCRACSPYLVFQYDDNTEYQYIGRLLCLGTQSLCGRNETPKHAQI